MIPTTRRPGRLAALACAMALLAAAGVGRPAPVAAARADGQQQLSFEDVVANLKVGDPRVKLDALKLLGQAGYLEAASTVAPLLADPTAEVQMADRKSVV